MCFKLGNASFCTITITCYFKRIILSETVWDQILTLMYKNRRIHQKTPKTGATLSNSTKHTEPQGRTDFRSSPTRN